MNGLPQTAAAAQQAAQSKDRQPPGEAGAQKAALPDEQGGASGGKKPLARPADIPARQEAAAPAKEPTNPTATGLPSAVRRALEGNVRAFAPVTLTIQKQRSLPDPSSPRAKRLLRLVPGFSKPLSYEYLAQKDMGYARRNYPQGERYDWQEFSWDGSCAYWGHLYLHPHALEIVPLEKLATDRESRMAWWYEPDDYLAMIGISVPRLMSELPAGRQSEVLRLLEKAGRLTATGNQRLPGEDAECFVAEVQADQKKHRFWLDPSLGHAVRRHEVRDAADELEVVIDNSDFVKLMAPDLWLPRHSHAQWQAWRLHPREQLTDKTTVVVDLQATRLERSAVPPERFRLNYGPGSYISDARPPEAANSKKGRIDYLQPDNPADIKGIIEAKQTGTEYVPPRRFTALWIVGVGLALFLAAAGVFVMILHRRRRRAAPAPHTGSDSSPSAPKSTGHPG
jgi:hypothetical protein